MNPFRRLTRALSGLRARRAELCGVNRRNIELIYANNSRRHYPLVDDKLRCKELLANAGVAVPETYAVCAGLADIPDTLAELSRRSSFVVKPSNGSGGDGVLVVSRSREVAMAHLRRHLAQVVFGAYSRSLTDRALVEEMLAMHSTLTAVGGEGVSDLRVITLRGRSLMAMLRIPTARSGGRANLHQGAVAVGVDLETGRTTGGLWRRRPIDVHPDSRARLSGIQLPFWGQVRDTVRRAASAVPLDYLGIDIVLDQRGPVVLELNARPGLEIQNVNQAGLAAAARAGSTAAAEGVQP